MSVLGPRRKLQGFSWHSLKGPWMSLLPYCICKVSHCGQTRFKGSKIRFHLLRGRVAESLQPSLFERDAESLSPVCLFATPWTVARQAPLSMRISSGKNPGVGWPSPPPGDLPDSGIASILAWRIPWAVLSMGLQRVRHNWATFTFSVRENIIQISLIL